MDGHHDLPAGRFSTWVETATVAQTIDSGVDVPCGSCTACCRSSYFIHIGPHETDTLRRVPRPLLVPAPGLPKGNMLLGFDERGHCPMLVDDRCSIYEHRPLTCRRYDCRVFAAAGLSPEDDEKPEIAAQVRRWRFDLPTVADEARLAAVRAAAAFLSAHPECFPDGSTPTAAGQTATLAVKVHGLFLGDDRSGVTGLVTPDIDEVRRALED